MSNDADKMEVLVVNSVLKQHPALDSKKKTIIFDVFTLYVFVWVSECVCMCRVRDLLHVDRDREPDDIISFETNAPQHKQSLAFIVPLALIWTIFSVVQHGTGKKKTYKTVGCIKRIPIALNGMDIATLSEGCGTQKSHAGNGWFQRKP